jgi:hypothetical protein
MEMKQFTQSEIDVIKSDVLKKLLAKGLKNVKIEDIEVVPLIGGNYIAQYLYKY